MVFGLPTPGEPNWDVKLDASIEAVKATADAAQPAASLEAAVAGKIGTDGALDSALSASYVGKGRQQIDVRDWGVIGDGTSRPLSTLYGSLAAAQADYPQATALTNELDWAALQSMSYANPGRRFLIADGLRCYTNLPIDVRDNQRWLIDGEIENAAPRNTPSAYMDQANVFRVGNMHPAILKAGSGYTWPTVALDDVAAGQRAVTVTTPGDVASAGVTLAAGDFVIVRSDGTFTDVGVGRVFDYQQFNKVISWDSGTGELVLERPIAVGITGAVLCINDGNIDSTTSVAQPWWMADSVTIEGHGMLYGASPFGFKMGAWKPRLSVRGEFQDAASLQAFVGGDIEIRDSLFTGRLLEVKFAAQDSRVRIRGEYVYSADVASPATTISIGEQANNIDAHVDLIRGPDFPSSVNALEVYAQGITVAGSILDLAAAGQQHTYAVRSTDHTSRPPADIDLSRLRIRGAGSRTRYGLIGDDAGKTGAPTRVTTPRNRTSSGTAPTYNVQVGHGTEIDAGTPQGDVVRVNTTGSGEVPQNGSWLLSSLAPVAVSSISAADTVGATAHRLANGQAIRFTSLTGGTGLSTGTTYYVVNRAADTFQVSTTPGGTAVDVTVAYTAAEYALTFPSGDTPYGVTFTMTGPKAGDSVVASMQNLLVPTAGSFGDLSISATVSAANTVTLYVRNRSATEVTFATGAPFWVYAAWQRRRV